MRALHPKPADVEYLAGLGITNHTVYESIIGHDIQHQGRYITPAQALGFISPQALQAHEKSHLTDSGHAEKLGRKKKVPKELRALLKSHAINMAAHPQEIIGVALNVVL